MTLSSGSRIGVYEIHSLLGAGGMGEVYRARDTRLDREVALKILPPLFTNDSERMARFQREARVLASLSHPNIAAVYGLEESDGARAIVMELVDGQTLADLVNRGPLPLNQALPLARQVAEALEAAHEKSIIHRDLKPANIKVTPDGTAKVLDFGLAKALDTDRAEHSHADTFSLSLPGTQAGVILGTAPYMSPEQARGLPVDKRSDIWAFGAVLFEMLTGRRAFGGGDVPEILASIIKSEPDWRAPNTDTPAAILSLIRRCLTKDRKQRLRDIGEARIIIEECLAASGPVQVHGSTTDAKLRRGFRHKVWLAWGIALVSSLAALALGVVAYLGSFSNETSPIRFSFDLPEKWVLTIGNPTQGGHPLAVSPDGLHVALVARNPEGQNRLMIRSLENLSVQELQGTEGASSPFWSPDSRFVGFFASGKLKKIAISGGPAITLCDALDNRGGTWSGESVILFAPSGTGGLSKVAATGGIPVPVTRLGEGETAHWRPTFLPDGRHYLYRAGTTQTAGAIYLASLDSPDKKLLFNSDSTNVAYSDGHLLFLRETTLMAQPFDARRLELRGEAFPIAERVQSIGAPYLGVFSASPNGVMAYQEGGTTRISRHLHWFDRGGRPLAAASDEALYNDVEISPDGKNALVSIPDPSGRGADLWICDLARGLRTRFTFGPNSEYSGVWSPDGRSIIFTSTSRGSFDLARKLSNGTGGEEVLLNDNLIKYPSSWSPDGQFLLYATDSSTPRTSSDVWSLPLSENPKPSPLIQTPFAEYSGRFSPRGRWVAYASNESGRMEVYVVPFPGPGGKRQISNAGGGWPRWRSDESEIFYLSNSNEMMVAAVKTTATGLEVGAVTSLFQTRSTGTRYRYDVSRDGQRFLINVPPGSNEQPAREPITVVVHWNGNRSDR